MIGNGILVSLGEDPDRPAFIDDMHAKKLQRAGTEDGTAAMYKVPRDNVICSGFEFDLRAVGPF